MTVTLSLDSPIKLLIISYRAGYTRRRPGCSCHPEYESGESDFEIKHVTGLNDAAVYIAHRLVADIHAKHSHVIFEDFTCTEEIGSHSYDASDIDIPGESSNSYSGKATSFRPGQICWPFSYDDQYEIIEGTEPPVNVETRVEMLVGELYKRIETAFMKLYKEKFR